MDCADHAIGRRSLLGKVIKQRLAHRTLAGDYLANAVLEVALMKRLRRIGARLGCGRQRRLEHGVPDIAAAHGIFFSKRPKVHVIGQRRQCRVHLHPPDLLAFVHGRHLEQHVGADAPLERRVEVCRKIGREDHHAAKRFELLKQHVDHEVTFALERLPGGRSLRRDGIGLVEK